MNWWERNRVAVVVLGLAFLIILFSVVRPQQPRASIDNDDLALVDDGPEQ